MGKGYKGKKPIKGKKDEEDDSESEVEARPRPGPRTIRLHLAPSTAVLLLWRCHNLSTRQVAKTPTWACSHPATAKRRTISPHPQPKVARTPTWACSHPATVTTMTTATMAARTSSPHLDAPPVWQCLTNHDGTGKPFAPSSRRRSRCLVTPCVSTQAQGRRHARPRGGASQPGALGNDPQKT